MNSLLVADLHITDHPADRYRWSIFPWISKRIKQYEVDYLFILGDLTDRKDNHSAKLTNRLVKSLTRLSGQVKHIVILMGNHDYVEPSCPFFAFLDKMKGITFIKEPCSFNMKGIGPVMLLPHLKQSTKQWHHHWRPFIKDIERYKLVLLHGAMQGAKSPTGHELDGMLAGNFRRAPKDCHIIAGDIHVPQTVGRVVYCGSPYPIHFGDNFKPRVLLLRGDELKSIRHTTIKKATITISHPSKILETEYGEGDQLRVTLLLKRADFVNWNEFTRDISKICSQRDIVLKGIELKEKTDRKKLHNRKTNRNKLRANPVEVFDRFCKEKGIGQGQRTYGKGLIDV